MTLSPAQWLAQPPWQQMRPEAAATARDRNQRRPVIATERCLASAVCTSAEKMPRKHRLLAAQSCTVRLSSDHTVDLAWLRSARDPNM
eukprot:4458876-Prymnesium_polylepis.1